MSNLFLSFLSDIQRYKLQCEIAGSELHPGQDSAGGAKQELCQHHRAGLQHQGRGQGAERHRGLQGEGGVLPVQLQDGGDHTADGHLSEAGGCGERTEDWPQVISHWHANVADLWLWVFWSQLWRDVLREELYRGVQHRPPGNTTRLSCLSSLLLRPWPSQRRSRSAAPRRSFTPPRSASPTRTPAGCVGSPELSWIVTGLIVDGQLKQKHVFNYQRKRQTCCSRSCHSKGWLQREAIRKVNWMSLYVVIEAVKIGNFLSMGCRFEFKS